MNIQEAKNEIKKSISIYLMKDEYGNYRIPIERQRPIFMMGAPGIGKTAIMAQIAQELGISLVSYSMTHHTRQSALGLPFIDHCEYQGKEFDVSRYTLSEILSSVYENMEKTHNKEGILFLDEINCVSETLGPSMLQFLQYKTFGNHKLPEGWVVVTAGNPAEFNRAVHEFDVATMDRLKVMNVEPDYDVWYRYAQEKHLHEAILSYLQIHRQDFYEIETTVDGKTFVTARGWEDLSEAIQLYEEKGFEVDAMLFAQYIHNQRIVDDFSTYYELFCKYRSDYKILEILQGNRDAEISKRAQNATYDERISVINLFLEAIMPKMIANMEKEDGLKMLLPFLRQIKAELPHIKEDEFITRLENEIQAKREHVALLKAASGISIRDEHIYGYCCALLEQIIKGIRIEQAVSTQDQFDVLKHSFDGEVLAMKEEALQIQSELKQAFLFIEDHFGEAYEMVIFVTQLTVNASCARFIAEYGSEEYQKHQQSLMIETRNERLMGALKEYSERAKAEGYLSLE